MNDVGCDAAVPDIRLGGERSQLFASKHVFCLAQTEKGARSHSEIRPVR